jgi:hypothetical protein
MRTLLRPSNGRVEARLSERDNHVLILIYHMINNFFAKFFILE